MDDPKFDPAELEAFLRGGGTAEEAEVRLALYGPDLEPDDVTRKLGRPPTSFHRRGDRRTPSSPPYREGAWILEQRGAAPCGPDDLVPQLMAGLPQSPELWQELAARYELQVRIAVHASGWNRGFELSPATTALVEKLGARVVFDLRFDGDEPPAS